MEYLPIERMPLNFAVFDFTFQAKDCIEFDNYPGFILRSGLGAAMHRLCLFKSKNIRCPACRLKSTCPYSVLFETPRPDDKMADFTAENFPHPFVFYPHFAKPSLVKAGETFGLTLTLFGKGIPYLLFYIYAYDLLGDQGLGRTRGRFTLLSVQDRFSGFTLYEAKDKTLRGDPQICTHAQLANAESTTNLNLTFDLPAKIEEKSRTVEQLTPDIFIRRLLRRASMLAELHMDAPWDIPFYDLIDAFNAGVRVNRQSLTVRRLERFTGRHQREHPLFAFTGSVEFSGYLAPFLSLIRLGSYIHIGNSTSQGFGRYVLKEIPENDATAVFVKA